MITEAPTLPTLSNVTDWNYEHVNTHRARVPAMPKNERTAWNWLGNQDKFTRSQAKLYRALTRKLSYRAQREIDKQYC